MPAVKPAQTTTHGFDTTEVSPTTAQLRAKHRQETSLLQKALDRLTAVIGWPGFVVFLILSIFAWVVGNLTAARLGWAAIDPAPFVWLQAGASSGALMLAALILSTQRREDRLADYRAQLILELSISNDQKIAKIVELLEESRRDNPAIANRIDNQAAAMAMPSDTNAVLEAIKEMHDDVI